MSHAAENDLERRVLRPDDPRVGSAPRGPSARKAIPLTAVGNAGKVDMREVVAFITARLDEAAERAAAAKQGVWTAELHELYGWRVLDGPDWHTATLVAWSPGPSRRFDGVAEQTAAYLVEHQPTATLKEIATIRLVIVAYEAAEEATRMRRPAPRQETYTSWGALAVAVRLLATRWDDHPDYQPQWQVTNVCW